MLSGFYDLGANVLTVVFSEPVQWSTLSAAQFHGTNGGAGTFSSSATGAQGTAASHDVNCTASGMVGVSGLLTYTGSPAQIVSTATGLPVLPFSNFPIGLGV